MRYLPKGRLGTHPVQPFPASLIKIASPDTYRNPDAAAVYELPDGEKPRGSHPGQYRQREHCKRNTPKKHGPSVELLHIVERRQNVIHTDIK